MPPKLRSWATQGSGSQLGVIIAESRRRRSEGSLATMYRMPMCENVAQARTSESVAAGAATSLAV